MERYLDLSHVIKDGETTYKGLPAPIVCDYLSREESKLQYGKDTSFHIGRIDMVGNTGTYIDCPFHRYEDGIDFSTIAVSDLVDVPGVWISVPHQNTREIGVEFFLHKNLKNKAVLVYTGWSDYWQTDQYFENHPYLTREAAIYLMEQQVSLVGIDSYNIDNQEDDTRPVHSVLLKNEIFIVEHLTNLHNLSGKEFFFSALPPKISGMGSFPVRAYAKITNT